MFLRIIIFIFALNTLIPSALAVGGLVLDTKIQMTDSKQALFQGMPDTQADTSASMPTAMTSSMTDMPCASLHDCKMMDMDNCDPTQCSTGYIIPYIEYINFLSDSMSQPQFILTHFYHIVLPVHTPPPLV